MLGLDQLLSDHMPRGLEDVPWPLTAAILCIARFCHPCSELYIERHFYPKSALEDLLGVESRQVQTDRLYRGMDHLLEQKQAIEQHLRQRLGQLFDLFDLPFDILLYDLTSTYPARTSRVSVPATTKPSSVIRGTRSRAACRW